MTAAVPELNELFVVCKGDRSSDIVAVYKTHMDTVVHVEVKRESNDIVLGVYDTWEKAGKLMRKDPRTRYIRKLAINHSEIKGLSEPNNFTIK